MLEKQSATTENVVITMDSQPIVISHSVISGTLTNQSSSINMNQQPSSVAVSGRSSQISSSGRIEPKLKLKNDHGVNTQ
jgi:hypothetical protein